MPSRTANSLASCVTRLQKEQDLKEQLIVRMRLEDRASLRDIRSALERGGMTMSPSGIRGVLHRHGIDTSNVA